MNLWSRRWLLGLPLIAAMLLSGCAGGYLLENNVQSFTSLTAMPASPTYRFERLPSQEIGAIRLESYADAALQKAGLRRDDASARYTVQLGTRMAQVLSPWATGWDGWGWGFHRHHRFGRPFPDWESPWYQREVSVIMRELPSNKVVFESHAVNDGPWLDNAAVFPAMFDAVMAGFPNPPAVPRVVNVQIGGK
jgi:hypothetical protein